MKAGDLVQTIAPLPNLGLDEGDFGICVEIKEYHEGRKDRGRGYFYFSNSTLNLRGAPEGAAKHIHLLMFERLKVVDSDDALFSSR